MLKDEGRGAWEGASIVDFISHLGFVTLRAGNDTRHEEIKMYMYVYVRRKQNACMYVSRYSTRTKAVCDFVYEPEIPTRQCWPRVANVYSSVQMFLTLNRG